MSGDTGTTYSADVALADGTTIEARVYLPSTAGYPDQHELTEVHAAIARMLGQITSAAQRREMPF